MTTAPIEAQYQKEIPAAEIQVVEPAPVEVHATVQDPPEKCRELAASASILDRLIEDLATSGLYGEDRAAKLVYLALTSRVFPRPVSLGLKGPSSAGKSFTVGSVLKVFPKATYYELTGMSPKALVYSAECLRHRCLVLFEATGLSEGTSAYFMRSLLSEGVVKWATVKKTPVGNATSLLVKEGPTGLITTTTLLGIHAENETRMLSVPVNDSAEQTRAVMEAIAKAEENTLDFAPWHALQNWLQGGSAKVTLPYAVRLAGLVAPVSVRLRRDFTTLLTLVKAHALLHRATRDIDADGAVIATLDDYAAIRTLIADLISDGATASVPANVRETVQAVARLLEGRNTVSLPELSDALRLDRSTVSRRVEQAREAHYLLNTEERAGLPARLVLGEPLPADVEVLPQVDALRG